MDDNHNNENDGEHMASEHGQTTQTKYKEEEHMGSVHGHTTQNKRQCGGTNMASDHGQTSKTQDNEDKQTWQVSIEKQQTQHTMTRQAHSK